MSKIDELDSNFKVETKLKVSDVKFYDVKQPPFKVYGVFFDSGKFKRMPSDVAKSVSEGVYALHTHTAGGRVRFKTDSSYIAIHAKMPSVGKMPHFALTGSMGFDLYIHDEQEKYFGSFVPPFNAIDGYESMVSFSSSEMREITINFPLYSGVSELYIGLQDTACVQPPRPYAIEKPIVFYGSSITQGGCASRPGNSYQSVISRRFDCDYINLGFSGSAKGEPEIADYISGLDMSVFVYDYDYNTPTIEHLKATHEKMFQAIRKAHPDLPIIIMAAPKFYSEPLFEERSKIIEETYNNAKANGDRHVYFIDGKTLMAVAGNEGTVDSCHPNDLGFFSMAKAVGDVLEHIL